MPGRLLKILRQMDAAGAVRIVRMCHPVELAAEIQALLAAGKLVLYMPRLRGGHHFHGLFDFTSYFEKVVAMLKDAEVVVPPSFVDCRLVFAIRPRENRSLKASE